MPPDSSRGFHIENLETLPIWSTMQDFYLSPKFEVYLEKELNIRYALSRVA